LVPVGAITPSTWIIATNLKRRHLTKSQCAAIAVELLPMLEKEAAERRAATLKKGDVLPVTEEIPEREGESRDQAGEMLGVSGRYVSDAKQLKVEAPTLFEEVRAGTKTITAARREAAGAQRVRFAGGTLRAVPYWYRSKTTPPRSPSWASRRRCHRWRNSSRHCHQTCGMLWRNGRRR